MISVKIQISIKQYQVLFQLKKDLNVSDWEDSDEENHDEENSNEEKFNK